MRQQCGRALKSAHLSYWKSLSTCCGLKSTELSIATIHAQTKSLVAIILMEPMYFVLGKARMLQGGTVRAKAVQQFGHR